MKYKSTLICFILLVIACGAFCQEKSHALSINLSVNDNIKESFRPQGRLFIYLITSPDVEPRNQGRMSFKSGDMLFAKSFSDWHSNVQISVGGSDGWEMFSKDLECGFDNIPEGKYNLQILWDQNFVEPGLNAPGNIYSEKMLLNVNSSQDVSITLSEIIEKATLPKHKHLKVLTHYSDTVSKWQGHPDYERAVVLLPSGYYKNKEKEYPISYLVLSGHGSLTHYVNRYYNNSDFFNWWLSDDAPQIIHVFLDGEINGNIYHVDSDNIGPFGYSLVNEFIPYIEELYRGTDDPETRFISGCSTGGWGSLALQLFYPETFNGVFSYSPDPITFERFLTTNIYVDDNLFKNEYGYENPLLRTSMGTIRVTMRHWVEFENLTSSTGVYTGSDDYFGIWSRLFSRMNDDGSPERLFDPNTGTIDPKVSESWNRYDLMHYLIENWQSLAPKLQGKIYIWSGTNDYAYLENAVKLFEDAVSKMDDPSLDAIFEYEVGARHCYQFSNRRVLEQISERLANLNKE